MPTERDILQLLREVQHRLNGDVSLETLAGRSGWSPFHLHRAFRKVVGETPKQYTLRLRLERAAVRLASGNDPVLSVASAAGFASHAVFTRAFRRQFGRTPTDSRAAALRGSEAQARARHAALAAATGPCVGIYHLPLEGTNRRVPMPLLSIERRELSPTPVLIVRARCARGEISKTIGESLGKAFPYAMRIGAALAGRPFTRYLSTGPGLYTIEAGCVLASPSPGDGDIEAATLPGGAAVVAMHAGSYETLADTYAEMERWAEKSQLRLAGAPWESYVTDPAEHPDPANWRTEIYWPVER